jgi:hypothetical protein
LKGADAAAAEAHVSDCPRCQATVAALVRATPAAKAPDPWWRRGWVVGSLVPLTAGAIALAIWVGWPDEARRAQLDRFEVQPPPPASAPQQEPAARADQLQAPPAREERSAAASPQRALKDESDNKERRSRAVPNAAPPTADARAAQSVDSIAAAPSALPPAAAREAAPLSETIRSVQKAAANEIASPDASVRWRVGASGSIQHSTNGGATWGALSSGVTEDLTAGAAPSPTVCWVVGRSGTVLRSTDGRRWQRVAFPEPADLVAVQASDAVTASVTTAAGRTFRTSDGGDTWTPLQEF